MSDRIRWDFRVYNSDNKVTQSHKLHILKNLSKVASFQIPKAFTLLIQNFNSNRRSTRERREGREFWKEFSDIE